MNERECIEAAAKQLIEKGLIREYTSEAGEVMWVLTDEALELPYEDLQAIVAGVM